MGICPDHWVSGHTVKFQQNEVPFHRECSNFGFTGVLIIKVEVCGLNQCVATFCKPYNCNKCHQSLTHKLQLSIIFFRKQWFFGMKWQVAFHMTHIHCTKLIKHGVVCYESWLFTNVKIVIFFRFKGIYTLNAVQYWWSLLKLVVNCIYDYLS